MHNSIDIKKNIGQRLTDARKMVKLSRKDLCDAVNQLAENDGRELFLNEATLKQWEYGNNQINIEWLPYLCAALHCDIGYIFGDYECKTRVTTDIAEETGLSQRAVAQLQQIKDDDIVSHRKRRFIDDLLCFPEFSFLSLVYEEYCSSLEKYNNRSQEYALHKEECSKIEISKEGYFDVLGENLRDAELKFILQLSSCVRSKK